MEMGEHSPGRGKPAKLPVAFCERPLSHSFHTSVHGWCMVQYGVNCQRTVVGSGELYTCCTTEHISW